VSFEKPADLFVSSSTSQEPKNEVVQPQVEVKAEVVKGAEASNTGTGKRKSKRKRDEVGIACFA